MLKKINNNSFSKNFIYSIVIFFPIIITMKSLVLNMFTILLSLTYVIFFFDDLKKKLFNFDIINFVLIFLFYIFINTIINYQNFEIVLKSLGNFRYILISLSVFFVLQQLSSQKKKIFFFINLFFICLIGLDIIYQYNFKENIFGFPAQMCTEQNECARHSGVFKDELIAGAYLSQLGLLFLVLIKGEKIIQNRYRNLFTSLIFLLLLCSILYAGERNAYLITFLSIIIFYLLKKKFFIFIKLLIFLMLIVGLMSQSSYVIKNRLIKFVDSGAICKKEDSDCVIIKKMSENPWIYHYKAAIELFLQKPITGHGLKSFRQKCHETNIDKDTVKYNHKYRDYRACSSHPHSYVFEFLSEQGLIGLLFYIGLILLILKGVIENFLKDKNKNRIILFGIGAIILSVIFPFKPSGSFFSTFNSSLFFYLLGFLVFYLEKSNNKNSIKN